MVWAKDVDLYFEGLETSSSHLSEMLNECRAGLLSGLIGGGIIGFGIGRVGVPVTGREMIDI